MPEPIIDLRSDTLTLPTPEMKAAMAEAALGDDCYGEDPTVNRLEALAAQTMGTEAALFVASGTMGNTCALLAHTRLGDEIIVEEDCHVHQWEAGAYANIAGVAVRAVEAADGIIRPEQLEDLVRPTTDPHQPISSLLCIENTHNRGIGSAWTPAEVEAVAAAAHGHRLKIHMDGARVFNAAVAVGVQVKEFARHIDSVTFCLSKGLSAPVGSVLCGSEEFMYRARRARKRLGGAMRQAGVIAAAGIVAIEQCASWLPQDHANALRLADGLNEIDGIEALLAPRPTNMVFMDVSQIGWKSADLVARLKERGVLANPRPGSIVRLVTHRGISTEDVEVVIAAITSMVEDASTMVEGSRVRASV